MDHSRDRDRVGRAVARLVVQLAATLLLAVGIFGTGRAAAAFPYVDLPAGHWAAPVIRELTEAGILAGTGGGRFAPERPLTRAEWLKMLVAATGVPVQAPARPPYVDVPAGHWAAPHADIALRAGWRLAIGDRGEDGRFRPSVSISRQEAAWFLAEALRPDLPLPSQGEAERLLLPFTDRAEVEPWARAAVAAAVRAKYLRGLPGGRLEPEGGLTRAQGAALLHRLLPALRERGERLARALPAPRPSGPPPGPADPRHEGLHVLGYAEIEYPGDRRPEETLARYGRLLDAVAPFHFRVTAEGEIAGDHPAGFLAAAEEAGVQPIALIHNMRDGRFDPAVAHAVLADDATRARLVREVSELVGKGGYAGVHVDLEAIPPGDRWAYTAFLRELRAELGPRRYELSAAVPAKARDDLQNTWSGGFDYRAIGEAADRVVLMTYDEHWAGGAPGPVASLPWVERVVGYATGEIPPEKILLGVAVYGYDWTAPGKGRALPLAAIPALVERHGGAPAWDDASQTPRYVYWDAGVRHELWYENEHTLATKVALARRSGLGGIAIWRLGYETPAFWERLARELGEPSS